MASVTTSQSHQSPLETCRIIIIGSARARIAKVFTMIQEKEASSIYHAVAIEFLPCVATFDSYPDEHGNTVRYLARVDYYPNGEEISLDGLLSFVGVDDSVDDSSSGSSDLIQSQTRPPRRKLLFPGISGVVVGPGFKDERDVESIRNFIQTLTQRVILVEAVPTEARMQEDNASEIARAIMEGINGMTAGERMGLFALDMAHHLIHRAFEQEANALPKPEGSIEPDKVQVEPERPERQQEYFDPNKNRYACRKCRTVLFGQDNMEDPPHTPSAHSFSRRKRLTINGCNTSICHSIFLTDGLSWMGDTQAAEGKLMCPKCSTKVGTWQWSGAQCSCGTWVVPALQIPLSKVDVVKPTQHVLPVGTISHPIIDCQRNIEKALLS